LGLFSYLTIFFNFPAPSEQSIEAAQANRGACLAANRRYFQKWAINELETSR
jgi:hypothetical protein